VPLMRFALDNAVSRENAFRSPVWLAVRDGKFASAVTGGDRLV